MKPSPVKSHNIHYKPKQSKMFQRQVQEHLSVMMEQEESYYCCSDYLSSHEQRDSGPIDPICRLKMTQWSYNVIDFIQFRRETVGIAMSYLDRFLCSGCTRAEQVLNCRKQYQLASMTTLFMAIKINEPIMIDMNLLTDLSKGLYTHDDFKQMEMDILFALNWRVNGPTAQAFMVHILALLKEQISITSSAPRSSLDLQKILEPAIFQIELSVGEYDLVTQKPSVVATASIWNSLEQFPLLKRSLIASLTEVSSLVGIPLEDVHQIRQSLSELQDAAYMEMRMSLTTIPEVQSPHSSTTTYTTTSSPQSSQDIPCTKDDSEHCSPNCVSKRNLMDQE